MPPIRRRDFLAGAASGLLLPVLSGCGESAPPSEGGVSQPPTAPSTPEVELPLVPAEFKHGVASGDPLPDRVMLWSRATPVATSDAAASVPLRWELAEDAGFTRIASSGSAVATPEADHTVKVDVGGLAPGSTYYYRFKAGDVSSPIGRTRTAPVGAVDRLRIAVVTCAKYSTGYYNAYRRVAERSDLQVVVHLGDYIYEGADADVRTHVPPNKLVTQADYRARYAQHREDTDLQELHRQHPMVWVWDDHEVANDAWRSGAGGHDPATDGDYETRRSIGLRTAIEWLPIRLPDPADPLRIHRGFVFGDLADLTMLDTRHYARDEQVPANTPGGDTTGAFIQSGDFLDPAREMIGAAQQAWLTQRMQTGSARWRLIGNQVIFSPLKLAGGPRAIEAGSVYLSNDKWDGYSPARDRALAGFEGVDNLVILTGDAHEAYAYDITPDPNNPLAYVAATGSGSHGVEFVATSITTRGDETVGDSASARLNLLAADAQQLLLASNPHLKFYQNTRNGYLLLDILSERLQGEFWFVPMVGMVTAEQSCDATFVTTDGSSHLVAGEGASTPMSNAPSPAP